MTVIDMAQDLARPTTNSGVHVLNEEEALDRKAAQQLRGLMNHTVEVLQTVQEINPSGDIVNQNDNTITVPLNSQAIDLEDNREMPPTREADSCAKRCIIS